jgi:hypothetical protein
MSKIIRLTESDLTRIVKRIVNEQFGNNKIERLGNWYSVEIDDENEYWFLVTESTHKIIPILIRNNKTYEDENITPSNPNYREIVDKIESLMDSSEWEYDIDSKNNFERIGNWYLVHLDFFSTDFNVLAQRMYKYGDIVDQSSIIVYDEDLIPLDIPDVINLKVYDEIQELMEKMRNDRNLRR